MQASTDINLTGQKVDELRPAVRLHARTAQLLGVDFLPIAADHRRAAPLQDAAAPTIEVTPAPATVDTSASDDRAAKLEELRRRHDSQCPHCTLATAHTRTVFGDGNPGARLMFIGEAPGAEEDRQGIPFVGRAGQKLNEMITAMGLRREDVYIANVLKARPPDNATPTPEEASRCGPHLLEQIEIIRPDVIVTLGKPAANYLLENTSTMSSIRGHWHEWRGIPLMPTFHPAYLLRAYTPENRRKVWSDLQQVMERLKSDVQQSR